MAWLITIGGVNKSALVRRGSISLAGALNSRSTCGFTIKSPDGSYEPAVGAEVIVSRDGVRLFAGYIWSRAKRIYAGIAYVEHDLTLVDYNFIAARRVAGDRSWLDQHVGTIVGDICVNDLTGEGVGLALIATGPVISGEWKITGHPSVLDALNAVTKQAKCYWYIDFDKNMRMFEASTLGYDAPFDITKANVMQLTPTRSLEDYANKIILHVQQYLRPEETETFNSSHGSYPTDGTRQTFGFPFPLASQPIVKVDGVATTNIGIFGVDEGKAWYWAQGSNYLMQDSSQTALTAAQTLEVTYVGIGELTIQRTADGSNGTTDQVSARAAAENSSGFHIQTFSLSDQANASKADEVADQLLATLSELPDVVTYRTCSEKEPLLDTLKPGDKQLILGVEYVVRSVKWYDERGSNKLLWLEAECVRGPLLKDFAELLKSLSGRDTLPMAAPATDPSTGGGGVTTPTQPAAGDWSLLPLEYSADAAGNQMVHLQANFTGAFPANADFLVFWLYQGAARPSDPGKWVDQFHLAAPGTNGSWIPQPLEAQDWQVCCTACSAEYFATPDASTPLKTVSVAAWKKPIPLQSAAIVAQSLDYNGRVRYRLKVSFTADPADKNFFVCRGDFNWCDSTFTPLAGDNGTWKNVIGSRESPMYIGGNEGFDAPLPENGPQYRQLRLYPIGFDQQPNYTGALIYNLTFLPDGGFRISSLDPAGLDTTMAIKTLGGVKKLAIADGGVGRPQIAAGHDLPQVVSGVPGTLGSRIVYDAAAGNIYRWNPAHGAYEWPMDGDAVKAVLAYSKLTSAEFAASIEPVGMVSFVPSVKSTSTIYNVTDGKTYRWNGSSYVRDTNSTEIKAMLSVDKLQAGQISAGAIGTTELSTAEILIGAGGGKCGRLRINDALGNMIGFHGDDGAGFVGSWASRARFGGTFSSPIIDLSSTGAAIANAALSLISGQFAFRVNSTDGMKVSDDFTGCDVQVKSSGLQVTAGNRSATPPVLTITPTLLQMDDALHNHTARLGFESIFPIGNAASLNIAYRGTSGISLQSFSGYDRLYSPRFNSRIDFTGGGGYCNIGEYRIGGNVVLDANRNYRFPSVFTEDLVLGGLTASKWVPCYDAAGAYQGKIPII